jgi:hypothetical protein
VTHARLEHFGVFDRARRESGGHREPEGHVLAFRDDHDAARDDRLGLEAHVADVRVAPRQLAQERDTAGDVIVVGARSARGRVHAQPAPARRAFGCREHETRTAVGVGAQRAQVVGHARREPVRDARADPRLLARHAGGIEHAEHDRGLRRLHQAYFALFAGAERGLDAQTPWHVTPVRFEREHFDDRTDRYALEAHDVFLLRLRRRAPHRRSRPHTLQIDRHLPLRVRRRLPHAHDERRAPALVAGGELPRGLRRPR